MTSWCSSGDFNTEPSAGCFALQPPVTRSASATLGHSPAACPGHQPLSQQQHREAPGQSRPRYGAAAASSAPAEGPASAAEGGAAVTEAQRVGEMGLQGLAKWHKGKPKARGSRAASRPRGTPLGSGSEPLGHEEGRGQAPELSGATRPCCSHSLGWGRAAGATQPPGTARGTPSPGDSQPHAAAPRKRLRPHLPMASRQLQPPGLLPAPSFVSPSPALFRS